jgi:cytochrome c oxidase subunit 1
MIAIAIAGFSSIFTGLSYRRNALPARPGLTWFRLPLFVWTLPGTSIISFWQRPLSVALFLVAFSGFWDRNLRSSQHGDPVLFQHLFWFPLSWPFTS